MVVGAERRAARGVAQRDGDAGVVTRERGDDREERRARQQDERAGGARAVADRSARGTEPGAGFAQVGPRGRGGRALLRRAARVAREERRALGADAACAADHRERVRGGSRLLRGARLDECRASGGYHPTRRTVAVRTR